MDTSELRVWLTIWAFVASYLVFRHWRTGRGVGLVFAYVLSFGAVHWLAALLYVLPWFGAPAFDVTAIGLRMATIATIALAIGAEVGVALSNHYGTHPPPVDRALVVHPKVVNLYLIAGGVCYLILAPAAGSLPTISALISTTSSLLVLGVALKAWNGWQRGSPATTWTWVGLSAGFPLMTVVGQGFLGFGFASMLIVAVFVASFYRPRWQVLLAGLLVAYMGVSVYVTYMRDRNDIRAVVWAGESVSVRFETFVDTFSNFEWFSLNEIDHLRRVDERLNQDALVGAAIQGIETGAVPLAMGNTLVDALIALVPRAIWPGKPVSAGSGNVVSDYTGLIFAEGTSVGIGHVMEWYINFAVAGVVGGFLLIGAVLVFVDRAAAAWLHHGDIGRFSLWFLPGTSLLNVGGSFVEMAATAAACWVVALGVRRITARWSDVPEEADEREPDPSTEVPW